MNPNLATWVTAAFAMCRQELERAADDSFVTMYLEAAFAGLDDPKIRALVRLQPEYLQKHQPAPPPPPPAVYVPVSLDAPIKANFCGHKTPWGETCFDIFMADWSRGQRVQVFDQKRRMGLTHIVYAVAGGYGGLHNFDLRQNPGALKGLLEEALAEGFRPNLALSSGDGGTQNDFSYVRPLLRGLGSVAKECHLFPAWEPPAPPSGWRSKHIADMLELIFAEVPDASVWFHGPDGRVTGASYRGNNRSQDPGDNCEWIAESPDTPDKGQWIEADDPWRGNEQKFWTSHGGEKLKGSLYQSESGRRLLHAADEPLDYLGQRGYLGRILECLMRLVDGYAGWRIVRFCFFEGPAEDYFAGRCTDADVTRIAREARFVGVTEFGNGLP